MSLILRCWGVLVLLCCLVILAAQTQPIPEFIPHMERCQDRMCYLGLVPGQTRREDAPAILTTIPNIRFDPTGNTVRNLPDFQGLMMLLGIQGDTSNEVLVDEIDVYSYQPSVNLGKLINQWGWPCAVVAIDDKSLGLIYPGMSLIVRGRPFRKGMILRPTSRISQVNLFPRFQSCNDDFLKDRRTFQNWQGFRPYYNS